MRYCFYCEEHKDYDQFDEKKLRLKGLGICIKCRETRAMLYKHTKIGYCPICNSVFKQTGTRKYCSKTCYKKYMGTSERREEYREYRKINSVRLRENQARYAQKRRKPKLVIVCSICNTKFETNNKKHKYCSDACRGIGSSSNRSPYVSVRQTNRKCTYCGKDSGMNKYCSLKCERHYQNPPKQPRAYECKTCGKVCSTFNPKSQFCGRKCQAKDPEFKAERNRKAREDRKLIADNPDYRQIKGKSSASQRVRRRNRRPRCKKASLSCVKTSDFVSLEKSRLAGQETDHIIPLNHHLVSGLNVPWNLQLLTCGANNFKSNRFDGTYENTGWVNDYRKTRK